MDKKILVFEYDGNKFVGVLEYREGKLIYLAGDVIYRFKLLFPFEYTIEYFQEKPQSNSGKMAFSLTDITLNKIVKEVADKVVYYFVNKERLEYYKKLGKEHLNTAKLNSKIDSLKKKNEILKENIRNLRKRFKNKELSQRDYQFKRKPIQTKIDKNNDLIEELKKAFSKNPYFEDGKLKRKFSIPYDKRKIKIKEIKDFEEKELKVNKE